MKSNTNGDQYQWNMAESFMRSLHAKLDKFSDFVFLGEMFPAHRVMKDIYNDIKHRIELDKDSEEIKKYLDALFKESETTLTPIGNSQNRAVAAQMMNYKFTKSEESLDKIKVKIMSLLYSYGLLYPKVAYMTMEEEIASDFA